MEDIKPLYKRYIESELNEQEAEVYRILLSGLKGEIADSVRGADLDPTAYSDTPVNSVIHGRDNVVAAVYQAVTKGTEKLVSNFDFDTDISPIVYRAFAEKKIGRIIHTVSFAGTQPAEKLKRLFYVLAFAEAGIDTYADNRNGSAWDSFILTDNCFIEYNNDLEQAIILPPENAPKGLFDHYDGTDGIAVQFRDAFDVVFKNEMSEPATGNRLFFSFANYVPPCFGDKNDVMRSIADNVPEKEKQIIANGLRVHYELLFGRDFYEGSMSNTLSCAITDTVITDFVKKGRINDVPEYLFPFVPFDVRANLLRPFTTRHNASIAVIYSKFFGKLKVYIEAFKGCLVLNGISGGDINAPGAFNDIRVINHDQDLIDTVIKAFYYFTNSYYCMDKSLGTTFLKHQVIALEALASEEQA